MASLDSLPPDQRAVLQLVLERGRTYDDIAAMLSIDRARVRQRALEAFNQLGPETSVDPGRRHLLTDYLLGQLPARVAADTRQHLAGSPPERAWARVVASELAPIAGDRLPEIPTEDGRTPEPVPAAAGVTQPTPAAEPRRAPKPPREAAPRRSSRLGGMLLLGLGALIAVVVVIIVLVSGGDSKSPSRRTTPVVTSPTSSSTVPTRVVTQINLNAPNGTKSPVGVAQVVKQAANTGIIIVASGVTPNSKHDAYAVWLLKPGGAAKILGFVNPGVAANGRLQTAGGLPADAAQYTQLLVTRETQSNPKTPGTTILQGNLKLTG